MPVPERRDNRGHAVWDPFREFERTATQMNELMNRTFGSLPSFDDGGGFVPFGDIEETEDAYVVELELPGIRKQDIDIETQGRRITVSGERRERERKGILRRQTRSTGQFFYEAVLPGDIDPEDVSASLDQGVLTIRAGKARNERSSRKIEIEERRVAASAGFTPTRA